MHDTKLYEAELDSTEKSWPRISHSINDWLINQISTGISLPILDEFILVYFKITLKRNENLIYPLFYQTYSSNQLHIFLLL